jgi:putative sterol carrier protein
MSDLLAYLGPSWRDEALKRLQSEFRILGNYETFARISDAELGAQKALMTGKLKLKGNLARALKLAAVSDRLNKVLSRIPTQY